MALHRTRQTDAKRLCREPHRGVEGRMPERASIHQLLPRPQIIEAWRIDFNLRRPHTSLDGLTPLEFATRSRSDHNLNRANL